MDHLKMYNKDIPNVTYIISIAFITTSIGTIY